METCQNKLQAESLRRLMRFKPLLVSTPGHKPDKPLAFSSHYLDPIIWSELAGNSRRWGDASLEIQAECCEMIVAALDDWPDLDLAFVLALTRVESGFNPDAAAGSSSACGLFQFIDRTRDVLARRIGIERPDPFEIKIQLRLFELALDEMTDYAHKHTGSDDDPDYYAYCYKYHHDGVSKGPGLEIARERVLPYIPIALKCIEQAM